MGRRKSHGRGVVVGRRCPKIQTCPKCGQMRVHHTAGLYQCSVPKEVTAYLASYARDHGQRWKSKLCELWASGAEVATELQQARNMIGPSRLYKISVAS